MKEQPATNAYERTLPLFDNEDRDIIQRLLHYAVEDLRYDHPDRKIARDLYHEIREGDAIRIRIGSGLENETLVINPNKLDMGLQMVIDRFIGELESRTGEWSAIAKELDQVNDDIQRDSNVRLAFQYLH